MTRVKFEDSAKIDIALGRQIIRNYFAEKESYEIGELQVQLFKAELDEAEERLATNPEMYPIRREYDDDYCGKLLRSFSVHWFILFYTYTPEEGVIVWYIRPSKSDYSNIIWLS